MGILIDTLDRYKWAKGALACVTVNKNNRVIEDIRHYARTAQEAVQHRLELADAEVNKTCGGVCALGAIDVAMGNFRTHNDTQFYETTSSDDWRGLQGEEWFKWVLTQWAWNLANCYFAHWIRAKWDTATFERYHMEQCNQKNEHGDWIEKPSIIIFNDHDSTTQAEVYEFFVDLQMDYSMRKLFALGNLTPPQKRIKYELFRELMQEPKWQKKLGGDWNQIQQDEDLMHEVIGYLMPTGEVS